MTEKSAQRLLNAWWAGETLAELPETDRPTTRADAYRVQETAARHCGADVAGWKIAATSEAGQAHVKVDGPMAGRIYTDRLVEDGAVVPLRGNTMRVAEMEFAFLLSNSISPDMTDADLAAAVATLHPAIEVPSSRFSDFTIVGAASLIADHACADWFLIGPAMDDALWRGRDLAEWSVKGVVRGKTFDGVGRNVLGSPWNALRWIAGEAAEFGLPLYEGQYVSTGTCLVPIPVTEGDTLKADWGDGVRLTLSFG